MTERKASMGDKVYRGDVVKFIRNNISLGTFMKRTVKTADEACWDLCDKLNYVPAIEESNVPHWIPVTERLPEKLDYYLVSGNNSVWLARYESGRFLGVLSGHALDTVIAWMPLPEPFKGVTE